MLMEELDERDSATRVPTPLPEVPGQLVHMPSQLTFQGGSRSGWDSEGAQDRGIGESNSSTQSSSFGILNHAHNFSMGSNSSITAIGRDMNQTNHYHYYPAQTLAGQVMRHDILKQDLSNWIGGPSFVNVFKTELERRMDGTGRWFLDAEEFVQLLEGTAIVLWGTGPPGTGKTVLSAAAVQELQRLFREQQDVVVVYAFLLYNEKHSVKDVLASLLNQMVQAHDRTCEYMGKRFQGRQSPDEQLTEKEITSILRDVVKLCRKVFVVVDGLDEASNGVKSALLRLLPSLGVNLLLMSRPLGEGYEALTPNALRVPIEALTDDIDLYVRTRIKESVDLSDIIQDDADIIEKLCSRVKEKSQGMFLVAHLQMAAIEEGAFSVKSLFEALESLPSGVDELYDRAVQRIEDASPKLAAVAKRVFTWLAYGLSRMTVEDMQYALAVSPDSLIFDRKDIVPAPRIVTICGGLVEVHNTYVSGNYESKGEIRFIHYTAKEYWKKIAHRYFSPNPHELLALTCISHLERDGGFFERYLEATTSRSDTSDAKQTNPRSPLPSRDGRRGNIKFNHNLFRHYLKSEPFLRYAHLRCFVHAQKSQTQNRLHPRILSFLVSFNTRQFPCPTKSGNWMFLDGLQLAAMFSITQAIAHSSVLPYTREPSRGYTPLHLSARQGDCSVLEALLRSFGDRINDQDKLGRTALHLASSVHVADTAPDDPMTSPEPSTSDTVPAKQASCGGTEKLRLLLLQEGVDVNIRDERGRTALTDYAAFGPLDALELLLGQPGIEINVQDNLGVTALMKASRNPDKTRLMLSQKGIDVNLCDRSGRTALMHCAASGSLDALRLLLSHPGVELNGQDKRGVTALMLASRGAKATQMILSQDGVDFNLRDRAHKDALLYCTYYGTAEALKTLVDYKSFDLNVQDREGTCPLAVSYRNPKKTRLLLRQEGIDVNLRDNQWRTPLMRFVSKNCDEDALEVLLRHPYAELDAQDERGYTILKHWALSGSFDAIQASLRKTGRCTDEISFRDGNPEMGTSGRLSTLKILFKMGRDLNVNDQDEDGRTLLMHCASSSCLDTLWVVLDSWMTKVDCNLQDKDGRTALMHCIFSGRYYNLLGFLELPDLDCNLQDRDGRTALMHCVLVGSSAALDELLAYPGIDPNLQDIEGKTALMMAAGHLEKTKLLLSHSEIKPNLKDHDGRTALLHNIMCKDSDAFAVTKHLLSYPGIETK